jgi:hypothetical protein
MIGPLRGDGTMKGDEESGALSARRSRDRLADDIAEVNGTIGRLEADLTQPASEDYRDTVEAVLAALRQMRAELLRVAEGETELA